jgi:hypothetical protein
MPEKYSYYLVQIYTCLFFNYLIPVAVPITFVTFIVKYWLDKYQLFNLSTQYSDMNYFITKTILKQFE